MAIITKRLGGDGDPVRGYVVFEVDYDNVALRLNRFALHQQLN